jgi:hypothetical protein
MRNEIQEYGKNIPGGTRADALSATAVDAALSDETALPIITQRGSRRELTSAQSAAERHTIDVPHTSDALAAADAPTDGALLRQLSQQLSSLQAQQDQIRRLLEQAEGRRAASRNSQRQRWTH